MKGKSWVHKHSDAATMQPPRYWPGDPILRDGEPGRVMFSKSNGLVCVEFESGEKSWCHESVLAWPPDFQPRGRR